MAWSGENRAFVVIKNSDSQTLTHHYFRKYFAINSLDPNLSTKLCKHGLITLEEQILLWNGIIALQQHSVVSTALNTKTWIITPQCSEISSLRFKNGSLCDWDGLCVGWQRLRNPHEIVPRHSSYRARHWCNALFKQSPHLSPRSRLSPELILFDFFLGIP